MPEEASQGQLDQIGETLHQRMVSGDVTATAKIAEIFMPLIIARLERKYSDLDDPHLIDTAVEDALLNYFDRPEQYDPARLNLVGYLYMSANGDLLNLLAQGKNESKQLRLAEVVELDSSDSEHGVEIQDSLDLEAVILDRNSPVWQELSELLPDPTDQELVLLIMDGVRETRLYADVLGISDLSAEEQAAIVKRHKDRLKKKLQRNIERSELSENG